MPPAKFGTRRMQDTDQPNSPKPACVKACCEHSTPFVIQRSRRKLTQDQIDRFVYGIDSSSIPSAPENQIQNTKAPPSNQAHSSEGCECCTNALDPNKAAAAITSDPPSEGGDHLGASDGAMGTEHSKNKDPQSKQAHSSEGCACCTNALDLDEAAAAIKSSDPSSIDPSSVHSEGGDHLGASDGGVLAVAGIVALFTLTGAIRVLNQSKHLIPGLLKKIKYATNPMRTQQLRRSLNNAYINLGATIVNVATMGGMLAGLAVAAATPIGWGLLIGYAGIQTIRHLQLVYRTYNDMTTHANAHEIAKTDYRARQKAYLGISASFACQGIGAILIIGGLASGFGAPLAIAGLVCVLAGSGGSLWLNNRYPRAYAPRNETYWGINRESLTPDQRSRLLTALKTCKTTLQEAYKKSSGTTIKWKKRVLRILGAFPMTINWQQTLDGQRKKLNRTRDEELNRLGDTDEKQAWRKANDDLARLIKELNPDPKTHPCSHGCAHHDGVANTAGPHQYPLSEIRYMYRALCDDEMTSG